MLLTMRDRRFGGRLNRMWPHWRSLLRQHAGPAIGVTAALVALGCSDGPKEAPLDVPKAIAEEFPKPKTSSGLTSVSMTWTTPLGPGGAHVPAAIALPTIPEADDNPMPPGISRLRGAIFPPKSEDILFVGTVHKGEPVFTPDKLLNGFTVALRALEAGTPPGVSIEPTSAQIKAELQEGDLMPVRYDGGTEHTAVGQVVFEGDRVMKALSSGRDNLTRAEFSSNVEGYRNRLDMHVLDEGGTYTPWTRFWIEQDIAKVEVGKDGTTVLVTPTLKVEAKSQVRQKMMDAQGREVAWKLVDGDNSITAPSAKAFAQHMTRFYDKPDAALDFVREFPVYRRLLVYATLVCLAEAVRSGTNAPAVPAMDFNWLRLDHLVESAETQKTTPATIARKKTATSLHMTRGGVNLQPINRYADLDAPSQALVSAIREAMTKHPERRRWQVRVHGTTYYIYAVSLADPALRIWQVDLRVGRIEIVRVTSLNGGGPAVGKAWSLRMPSVALPDARVTFASLGQQAPFVVVQGLDGRRVHLHQVGQATLPGQPVTLSYSLVTPNGRERRLLMYSNEWIYVDGHVDFVTVNGGPITWKLASDTSVLHFAPRAPHGLRRVRTSEGTVEYIYDTGGRLDHLASDGTKVELVYDRAGNLAGLRSNGHGSIDYQITMDGFLDTVEDVAGNRINYSRDPGGRQVTGMQADDLKLMSGEASHPRFAIQKRIPQR